MSWIPFGFNLCLALLFAGYVVYRVRRFERWADALIAKLDRQHEERMRDIERRAAEEEVEGHTRLARLKAETEEQIERSNAELRAMTASFAELFPDAEDPARSEPVSP